jgi:hypothetical protein
MPVSLPHAYPARLLDTPSIGLPAGTSLLVVWAVVMLTVGLLASVYLDAGPMDEFQLLASF